MLNYHLVKAPTAEPVSVDQLRAHLRMGSSFTMDDALLSAYLIAAREYAEKYTNRAFLPQQWCLSLDHFPIPRCQSTLTPEQRRGWPVYGAAWNLSINLPRPRCVSVDSITFTDLDGSPQTLDPSTWTLDKTSQPARLQPAGAAFWPLTSAYLPGSVQILFTASSYPTPADVPQTLVVAIMLLAAHWYAHSESTSSVNLSEIPFGVSALLDMHKFTVLTYENP